MNDLEFLDILNMLSFAIGVQNLDNNLDQSHADQMLKTAVEDIHKHLNEQDIKINTIMKQLEDIQNDKDKTFRGQN